MKAVKAAGASGVLLHHSSSFHDVQAPNARPYEASRIQMYINTVGWLQWLSVHGWNCIQYLQLCWYFACNVCHLWTRILTVLYLFWGTGLVVPDLPLEETGKLHKFTVVNDLELVCLLSNPFLASTPQLISCFQCAISLPLSLPCPASVKQEDMCNVRREPSTGKSIKTSLIMHV